ncbi:MAG TPA: transposase domain-containing protein [Candidatus Merdibacter merdavium]|uniref:Transposase domain-containing protein n=1 Tax=Candidatus Merdibacter merdavium TaxID=2838692 RepID=A0A9D2SVH5_9FIRM|nr:transposase domain-containing protein [Candidatus Merdibacter merdavium]
MNDQNPYKYLKYVLERENYIRGSEASDSIKS